MYLCFKWIDANVKNNKAIPILPWTEFDHPQLGKIEIGSLDYKYTWQNCPVGFLEQEVEKNTNFCIRMAATCPHLNVDSLTAEKQAEGVYKITALVRNLGYLPTFVCNEAKRLKVDKELIATLTIDGEFIIGCAEQEIGHLEGFSGVKSSYSFNNINTFKHDPFLKQLTWVIHAAEGSKVALKIANAKSGSASAEITL